ncbi:MAG: phosphoglycerate dehydrogenase [Enterococcus sp.]
MKKKIIFSTRPFRDEFIQKIYQIAPDYEFRTTATSDDFSQIEISIGWQSDIQDRLLATDSLRWVQALSAGVDYLPLDSFSQQKILLTNGSGIHAQSITQHVLGTVIAYYRGLFQSLQNQQQKLWAQDEIFYQEYSEKTMLIVGTGQIGKELAQTVRALGIHTIGINTTGHFVEGFDATFSLEELPSTLEKADIVVNILPLTQATHHLFNLQLFSHFKSDALFINVGRGASVNTADLMTALSKNYFAFAALDVLEEEPLPQEHPLWDFDNVLITPHIAGLTPGFQQKFMAIFLPNLEAFVNDQEFPINHVDLSSGY